MGVNSTGAGGVSAGSLYVGQFRYDAQGKSPQKWNPNDEGGNALAVDQATGDVYLLTGLNQIKVFNATGSQLITTFGAEGAFEETIKESPDKFHGSASSGEMAVDSSGNVYVADSNVKTPTQKDVENRIMVFKPETPGDYEHYVYASGQDIGFNTIGSQVYDHVGVDDQDDVYAATEEGIYEFAPGQPSTPVCTLPGSHKVGQMTVDAATGEVFYYGGEERRIVQLNACNAQGKFTKAAEIAVEPRPAIGDGLAALAFDPSVKYPEVSPGKEASLPGILYGIANGTSNVGRVFAPLEAPPVIESESFSAVTATTATLGARIASAAPETRYTVQYISTTAYEANGPVEPFAGAGEAPSGGGVLGVGASAQSVSAALSGLAADTQYHFRVVASSHCDSADPEKVCQTTGPGETFRTFAAETAGLPDGRAYELVSPAFKDGGEVFPAEPIISSCLNPCKPGSGGASYPRQSAPDGEAVVYEGYPFSFTEGSVVYNEYLSRRGSSGWETLTLAPKSLTFSNVGGGYKAFDAGLNEAVIYQDDSPSLAPTAPSEYGNLYTQPVADPSSLTPLVTVTPPNREPATPEGFSGTFKPTFAGASADLSRQFFAANDALTGATEFAPAAIDGGQEENNLYESHGGELRLVNVLPGNTATAPGASYGTLPVEQVSSNGVNDLPDFSHAISDDGSVAFWSDQTGQVYARVHGETTIEIPDPTLFLTASVDGAKVLLRDGHIYDLSDQQTTDLTAGQGGFQGIVGQSEDLSTIYFVDTADLTGAEQNEYHDEAKAGEPNLYVWHEDGAGEGTTGYVATLSSHDDHPQFGNADGGDWAFSLAQRSAEASPDGRWVAFLSQMPLTGYDNIGACFDEKSDKAVGGPCREAFLYDSATHKLRCASCDPSEAPPLGRAFLPMLEAPGAEAPAAQPRYLLNNGRLYFDSRDSLSPFDTNNGVEDVYQYEPEGMGGCHRGAGCVNLISAGREPVDSNFLAVDETGKNVFFTTEDRLVQADKDDLFDLYDAREDGGFPSDSETGHGECQGENCQASASAPSGSGASPPGSLTFSGAGNLIPLSAPVIPAKRTATKSRAAQARAEKLSKALRACRKEPKRKRAKCEKQAKKRYGKGK